jgi:aminopeptidase YwaD
MLFGIEKAVAAEYSGIRAKEFVAQIVRFHRIQASPGFRQAARWVHETLVAMGVEAELLSFPADDRTQFWGCPSFQEWDASDASLHLIAPADRARKLADYAEVPVSLIQRSAPVEHLEADVVLLEDGEEEREYRGLDLTGKVVLTRGDLSRVRELAVGKHGAVGILFDGMREAPPVRQRIDLPDGAQYTSFWWNPGEAHCFGFVLSPRQGEDLRNCIRQQQRAGEPPPRVRAHVASRLYDGELEVVSALIPGRGDDEVVVTAHLCHPRPSANDNASGAAALLELARCLHQLIASGRLPHPQRSIRLLWVPEMNGTYAYLSTHEEEIPGMVAGLNLDMVGEDQEQCKSVFIIERPPEALPSFAADLLEHLRSGLMSSANNLAGSGGYSLVRHTVTPFSGGSDHWILSDPTVGVSTPMLIQWPDKFYHTSEDTLDKVDPSMLALSGSLASCFAYFVAACGQQEVSWLAHEMAARFRSRVALSVQDAVTEAGQMRDGQELAQAAAFLERRALFAADRQGAALRSLLRLSPQAKGLVHQLSQDAVDASRHEVKRASEALSTHAHGLGLKGLPSLCQPTLDKWNRKAAQRVPTRRYRGPVQLSSYLHRLSAAEQEQLRRFVRENHQRQYAIITVADYWVDGMRTIAEIADLTDLETGQRGTDLLVRYYEFAEKAGLVTLKKVQPRVRPIRRSEA